MGDLYKIDERDVEILRIIERGHPERSLYAHRREGSQAISGLTWDEIQVASGRTLVELSDSIASLGGNSLIDNGKMGPGFLGWLGGKEPTTYFWITEKGRAFLRVRTP